MHHVNRPSRNGSAPGNLAVPDSKEFYRTIRRERLISDRTGSSFTLVLFSITPAPDSPDFAGFLLRIRSRMRVSDCLGWFDRKRLGVLLPDTFTEGAVKFAENVTKTDPEGRVCPEYRVKTYPEPERAGTGKRDYALSDRELQTVFVRRMPGWKRTIDVVGALTALLLVFPVMVLTALYIKAVSPGPVFFRQKRVGYRGEIFTFLKFRTMKVNNDVSTHREHLRELINSDTPMKKLDLERDPRIIPGGELIRKLSIDELPQFFNVLRGEMSLIGPRPCIPYEAEEYLRWHTHRFDAYPGLSGLWQVSGKNRLSFKEMIRLDITYANHMSLSQDIRIILRTIPTLIGIALEKPVTVLGNRLSKDIG